MPCQPTIGVRSIATRRTAVVVPSGRSVRLEYDDDGGVSASVKLQELFGLADTPRVGVRKEPVRLALLAPNGRPVQMTRDLRSFWDRTYPEVRKELRGRYPKHPWPDDPWKATPTARTRNSSLGSREGIRSLTPWLNGADSGSRQPAISRWPCCSCAASSANSARRLRTIPAIRCSARGFCGGTRTMLPFVGSWWDGLAFFPLRGSLAFSDHRVGLELIAGPVLWLGGTPILAYNVTFVACFVLSALAAHALTRMLTGSHAAGAVSGIAFGFNPYRMAHLAHLELQAAFCLPLALFALHRYVATSRRRWLVAFWLMLALQGLCSGYYLFFSIPLVGLWILWFSGNAPFSRRAALVSAWALAFIVLLPVLLQYRAIHSQVGFGRGFGEMRDFSADLTGVLSAQPMKLWRVPSMASNPEAEVYVGVFAPLLILGAIGWRRSSAVDAQSRQWRLLRLWLTVVAVVFALVALSTVWGPWTFRLGPVRVSADGSDKPLTVAFAACVLLVLTSASWAAVWRERSTFAFYVTSGVIAWLFALGPAPHFLNRPLLYRGPYALLMLLPGFADGFRAPARFMMIAALAIAVAAGLAFVRLTASRPGFGTSRGCGRRHRTACCRQLARRSSRRGCSRSDDDVARHSRCRARTAARRRVRRYRRRLPVGVSRPASRQRLQRIRPSRLPILEAGTRAAG